MLIPLVISDLLARQEAHVLIEFGAIGTPHMQHNTLTKVPPGADSFAVSTCILYANWVKINAKFRV